MKLQGKVAVVTGGNSGIGLATAQEFKAQGAEVVIFGRSQETLEDAVQTIGNRTLAVQGDVTDLADLDRLYQQTVERFGKVDILMVNAGIAKAVSVEQLDEALFDEISNTNFKGTVDCITLRSWAINMPSIPSAARRSFWDSTCEGGVSAV